MKVSRHKKFEILKSKNGFARNFLLPNNMALRENKKNLEYYEKIKEEIKNKELEIIKEELKNSGKKTEMIDKIATGKIKKFISDNTLLNQIWIMDTKMKVSQVLKNYSEKEEIKVIDFVRFKVGEGI